MDADLSAVEGAHAARSGRAKGPSSLGVLAAVAVGGVLFGVVLDQWWTTFESPMPSAGTITSKATGVTTRGRRPDAKKAPPSSTFAHRADSTSDANATWGVHTARRETPEEAARAEAAAAHEDAARRERALAALQSGMGAGASAAAQAGGSSSSAPSTASGSGASSSSGLSPVVGGTQGMTAGRRPESVSSGQAPTAWIDDSTRRTIVFAGHQSGVSSAAWSHDGDRIVSGSPDGTVRIWKSSGDSDPTILKVFEPDRLDLFMTTPPSESTSPVTADEWKHLRRQSNVASLLFGSRAMRSIAFGGPNQEVVTFTVGNEPRFLSTDPAKGLLELNEKPTGFGVLGFGRDGASVADPQPGGGALVLSTRKGESPRFLGESRDGCFLAQSSASTDAILTAHVDGRVRIWSPQPERRDISGAERGAWFLPVSNDIVTRSSDETLRVWTRAPATPQPVEIPVEGVQILTPVFSPDGQRIASIGKDGVVRIWPRTGGDPVVLKGHEGGVLSVSFSPDGTRVVTTGADMSVRVWRVDDPSSSLVFRAKSAVAPMAIFSPDGRRILTPLSDGSLRIWFIKDTEPEPVDPNRPPSGKSDPQRSVMK